MAQGTCSVEGCEKPTKSRGLCGMHYHRWQRYGDPLGRPQPKGRTSRIYRFLVDVAAQATTDDCICLGNGTQQVALVINGKRVPASRAVWIIANGDPGPLQILHTCNGGSGSHGCVNIRHLYAGTKLQNMRDMVQANRSMKGSRHPLAKLTETSVRSIRRQHANGVRVGTLAGLFGVSQPTISAVIARRTWNHI